MVLFVDRGVGKICQVLKDNGIDDNMIIIFMSDNGVLSNFGLLDFNRFYCGWKVIFFEGGVYIFFIVGFLKSILSG